MNWNTTKIEKEVAEGQTVTVQFEYLGNKSIRNVDPHCGCTSYTWKDNTLTAHIDVGLVRHAIDRRVYESLEDKQYIKGTSIDVYYEGEKVPDNLQIKLTVKEVIHGKKD